MLTINGERKSTLNDTAATAGDERSTLHLNERFAGSYRRVVSLPDDIDPNTVAADYRDGVLHISIARQEAAPPRRINVH